MAGDETYQALAEWVPVFVRGIGYGIALAGTVHWGVYPLRFVMEFVRGLRGP